MSDATPLVSILIPVRAEAPRIERCLDAVLSQDWPAASLQVVVVDGAPGDGTADVARRVLDTRPDVESVIVANPDGERSANLNVGLQAARGDVVCRVDARCAVPSDYVSTCVELLADPAVAVVGGSQLATGDDDGPRATAIVRALNNRFGMGLARYRRDAGSGPADTVYLGAFRRHDLVAAGGWDERLRVNEDFDANRRLAAFGQVWFDSRLSVPYLPRGTAREIAQQYWGFGRGKVRYLRLRGERARPRQLVGLLVAPAAAVLAGTFVAARPSRRIALGAAVVGGALALDVAGSPGASAPAGLGVRARSIGLGAVIALSWSAGGWSELVAPRRG